jgi:methyl-accepting chemotaxis protein
MPTTEYSPIIEAAGTLDGLSDDVREATDLVADLRTLTGRFETATLAEANELVGDLDDLSSELVALIQNVQSTVGIAVDETNAAIEALPDDSQLIDAVLDVERGLGTWADVVALARKLV